MAGRNSRDRESRDNAYDSREDNSEGKLFVGGLAWDSNEESIRTYFENFGPNAVHLKKNKDDPSKHRGFAFVTFPNPDDAVAVLKYRKPHLIDGSKVDPKSACPLGIKPEQRTKKIFVGGLSAETTEERLREYFGAFGEIQNNIEFATDHVTKKRRGFCFIEFASEAVVDRIVKDVFHEVAGKKLETKRALTKQQQQEAAAVASPFGALRGRPAVVTYGTLPMSAAGNPYGQPVIYIHPDSLSTGYPMSALGLSGLTQQYSSVESLYQPYARESRHAATSHGSSGGSRSRYDPYRK